MINKIKTAYSLLKHAARDLGIKSKRSSKWKKVRDKFLLNNPTCEVCGANKNLNVHHKKPFHLYPELELDENNLVTLCIAPKECHLLIAHGNNYKFYNPNLDSDIKILQKDLSQFDKIATAAMENRIDS